jgi:hypothetical protein
MSITPPVIKAKVLLKLYFRYNANVNREIKIDRYIGTNSQLFETKLKIESRKNHKG